MLKMKFVCFVVILGLVTLPFFAGAEALNLDFCDSLQKVLENSLLEGVDLGEFQYFLDMFQPNSMDLNGKIYADLRTVPIPNVAGLTEVQAKTVLRAWGFNVVETFYTTHPSVPEGVVIRTDPGANKKVIAGSDVRLRVSTGTGDEQQPSNEIPAVEFVGNLSGNGILDIANEFGLMQRILNDASFNNGVLTHEQVYNAWIHNLQQFQTDMGPTLSAILPGLIPGLQEIFLAYLTLGDGNYTIYSQPTPNEFEGYMNGGVISPPTPSIAKGTVKMTQTLNEGKTNITGITFDISLTNISGITSITAVKIGDPAFTWWSLGFGKGDYNFSYTITAGELAMIDTTKVFPNDDYWNTFYIIVKTQAYPDGEIAIRLGDLEPRSILAEGQGSFGIIAGLIALLDEQLRKATREQFGTEMGFDNPYLNKENYVGLNDLLPEADADGDGASNRCEYEWFEKEYCRELLAKCAGSQVITKEGVDTGSNSTRKGSFVFRLWYDPESDEMYMDVEITPAVTLSKITQIGIFDGKNNTSPLIYNFPGPFTTSPYRHTITQGEFENLPEAENPHLIICTSNQPGITDRGEIGASLIQYCPSIFGSSGKGLLQPKEEVIRYVEAALTASLRPEYCTMLSGCHIQLKNDRVVPPVPPISSGTAYVDTILYLDSQQVSYKITIEHTVSNPISAGLYAGDVGENGSLVLDLGNPASPIERVLTPGEYQLVTGSKLYILITSSGYPNGELRAQLDCTSQLRFVNASFDSQTLDVCMNGLPAFVLTEYPSVTGYITVFSNEYNLRVLPGMGTIDTCSNAPILSTSLDVAGDSSMTIVATGFVDSLELFALADDNRAPEEGFAKIRFVNAVKNGYDVDFSFAGWPPELTPLFTDISALTSTQYYGIAAPDVLDIIITLSNGPEIVIATAEDVQFLPDGVYTIFLVGPVPLKNGYQILVAEDRPGELPPEGEGVVEGSPEGIVEGEGTPEGVIEGTPEGAPEGPVEGEGTPEGTPEGVVEGEGEGAVPPPHSADQNGDNQINLSELLRVIQFFNSGGYHCNPQGEDGYAPGPGDQSCTPHASDYNPQDWTISLSELLRLIQFFNIGRYHPCPGVGEDGYCPGPA